MALFLRGPHNGGVECKGKGHETRISAVAETARCFVSLNISLKVTGNDILGKGLSPYYISSSICRYLVPFLRYSALNNDVTLKSELEVTQRHSKWYHSNAWVRFPIRLP